MDHHCPWIGNCVGYHNMKPFFLFTFYQACSGVVFFIVLWQRIWSEKEDIPELTNLGGFTFWVTVILDMPISFALVGLTLGIFS